MSGAIESLQADRAVLLELCGGFDEADWAAPSGCEAWSVQDVVAHMATLYWTVVDPTTLPDTTGLETERAQDRNVGSRRSWTADKVLADYESVSAEALERLAGLEGMDFELPLGDLGTYAAAVIPNAFAFDHYVHIRADLFAPRGPLTGAPPPSDELRLAPTLDWVEAALPQQNAGVVERMGGAVEIDLRGPGARTIRVGTGESRAQVSSDTSAFVRWITQRASWDDAGATGTGDPAHIALARELRVF